MTENIVPSGSTAALGFAPHSGWAAMIGVGESGQRPLLLARDRIEMAEAGEPGSKQPYHTLEGLPIGEAEQRLSAFEASASRMAYEAVVRIAGRLAGEGHRVVGVGILDSAGRKGGSLAAILASHALIHTADGDHFRNAIAAAAARCRLAVSRVRSRDLDAEAAVVIGRAPHVLREALAEMGREAGPPWAADQKAAALLAWLVLARESSRVSRREMGEKHGDD